MRGKSTNLRAHKEMTILNMNADHFKMNDEEKLVLQKMRDLFKQLRGLSHEERKDSLITPKTKKQASSI
jgi:alpha-galactosidase